MRQSSVSIPAPLKRYVVKWQGWLGDKTGRYFNAGEAIAIACECALCILDEERSKDLVKDNRELAELLGELRHRVIEWVKSDRDITDDSLRELYHLIDGTPQSQ